SRPSSAATEDAVATRMRGARNRRKMDILFSCGINKRGKTELPGSSADIRDGPHASLAACGEPTFGGFRDSRTKPSSRWRGRPDRRNDPAEVVGQAGRLGETVSPFDAQRRAGGPRIAGRAADQPERAAVAARVILLVEEIPRPDREVDLAIRRAQAET